MSCGTVRPGDQGEGEHLGLIGVLSLHGDHGTQLGQWKESFGHKLISYIWIIISAEIKSNKNKYISLRRMIKLTIENNNHNDVTDNFETEALISNTVQ